MAFAEPLNLIYDNDFSIILRILVACLLSGLLGWERESAGKAAGLRTHILVGVAAVIFVSMADVLIVQYQGYTTTMGFDPVRVIEALVTGVSFLGAGMIIFRRGKGDLQGLTTAAGILTTSAIGALVGLERYFLATASTAIVFSVLRLIGIFEERVFDPEETPAPKDESVSDDDES